MRPEKIQLANDIANLIVGAQFVYFISYKGLKNKELNAFRDKLFEAGAVCHVLKNRMVQKNIMSFFWIMDAPVYKKIPYTEKY